MKVLNYGSLNIDYVYEMDEFVKEGETKSSLKFTKNIGQQEDNGMIEELIRGLQNNDSSNDK